MVLEAFSIEFRTGCPWELLYADDLVLVAETMEELVGKFEKWKTGLEDKRVRVNAAKTKVMISSSEARSGFEVAQEKRYGFRHGFQHTRFLEICNVSTFTLTDTP